MSECKHVKKWVKEAFRNDCIVCVKEERDRWKELNKKRLRDYHKLVETNKALAKRETALRDLAGEMVKEINVHIQDIDGEECDCDTCVRRRQLIHRYEELVKGRDEKAFTV